LLADGTNFGSSDESSELLPEAGRKAGCTHEEGGLNVRASGLSGAMIGIEEEVRDLGRKGRYGGESRG
jgi:hypothetical protein